MKWLIYGHKGWIGCQVVKYLQDNLPEDEIMLGQVRLENYQDLLTEVFDASREMLGNEKLHILSFTGRTHGPGHQTIDYLEHKDKLSINLRDNLFGPLNLAIICRNWPTLFHLTYFGTGCIFSYDQIHPIPGDEKMGYRESDVPNFFGSNYSVVKGFTDQLMQNLNFNSCLNLRIRMPIIDAHHPRNLITKITGYKKVIDIPNSMTVLPELIPIMIHMSQNNETGTYNFTNPNAISHNKILEMYKKYIDNSFSWGNFTEEEQNKILAAKRSNNLLDTSKLEKYCTQHELKLNPIETAIKNMFLNGKY